MTIQALGTCISVGKSQALGTSKVWIASSVGGRDDVGGFSDPAMRRTDLQPTRVHDDTPLSRTL